MDPLRTQPADAALQPGERLTLREQGCFFVPAETDGRKGHMYVEYMVPALERTKLPVLMLHGGSQSGCCFRTTPDGRPGWQEDFLRAGHPVYLVDLPGSGRAANQPIVGSLRNMSREMIEALYAKAAASNLWPGAAEHTPWVEQGQDGQAVLEQFALSQYGSLVEKKPNIAMHIACCEALLDKIGRCIVLAHSLGATAMWPLAQSRSQAIAAMVAVEPNGPPFCDVGPVGDGKSIARDWGISYVPLHFDPPIPSSEALRQICDSEAAQSHRLRNMQSAPVLVVTGAASYHAPYDGETVEFLRHFGVAVEHMELGSLGIRGNGHMLMLEANSALISNRICAWLEGVE